MFIHSGGGGMLYSCLGSMNSAIILCLIKEEVPTLIHAQAVPSVSVRQQQACECQQLTKPRGDQDQSRRRVCLCTLCGSACVVLCVLVLLVGSDTERGKNSPP